MWKRLAMVAVDSEVLALGSVPLARLSLSPGKRSGMQVVVSKIYSTWPGYLYISEKDTKR